MLPTPRASDGAKGSPNQHGRNMEALHPTLCNLLPTPTTRDHKGRNQRDDETCLPGAVEKLLPTPVVTDARGALNATCGRNKANPSNHTGMTLTDALRLSAEQSSSPAATPKLLPTPEAKNSHAGQDYARATREHSGGHDPVTALMLTEASSRGASTDPRSSGGPESSGEEPLGLW